MSQWRLTLDVPFSFPVEQGFVRDVKSCDFRDEPTAAPRSNLANLWREPIQGIVMLKPSVADRSFVNDFKGKAQWNLNGPFWSDVRRAWPLNNFPNPDAPQPFALLMAPVKPAAQRFEMIEHLIDVAVLQILAAEDQYDDLKWVMQSKFSLAEDESFAIHYHGMTDEMVRKNNWFALQWSNIGLHFGHTGNLTVYQYDLTSMTSPPFLLQEIQICSPSDILNRAGYFWFIPIPGLGLAVYHGLIAQKHDIFGSSTQNVSVRGKLIPWTTQIDGGGHPFLFTGGPVNIGMNPYHPTMIGFQNIRFPTAATGTSFQDGAFSLPYVPSLQPAVLGAAGLADRGTVTAALMAADGGGPWDPTSSTAHLARVQATLGTADPLYTPFVGTYGVRWAPVFASRATTPLVLASRAADGVDRLERLEWSDDADSHFEGEAQLNLYSFAAQVIAFRGDATFLLEHSEDAGATWNIFTGGFAKDWVLDVLYSPNWGTYYQAKVRLYDMWERFDETHVLWQTAFDGLLIGRGLNNVLGGSGFPPIADADFPADALSVLIQKSPDGTSWRYSPREGEKTRDVIALLLLYLRKQNVQYRLRFSWAGYPTAGAAKWILEARPRDLATIWSLLPLAGSRNELGLVWDYSSLRLRPEPPEANFVLVEGMTVPNPQFALRVSVPPLVNADSLTNTASQDYLGRALILKVDMPEVTDEVALAIMERRFYDAIAHHRGKADIESKHFTFGLAPNTRIQVYRPEGSLILDTWIKRRTVVIEQEEQEVMRLECDTVWEEPIGRA